MKTDTEAIYLEVVGEGLAPPAFKLVFYKRNTAALFFCFTRIAIIYPLFCCARTCSSPTTATVKFYKNKEEMYLIRYISSNFIPNHNFLKKELFYTSTVSLGFAFASISFMRFSWLIFVAPGS